MMLKTQLGDFTVANGHIDWPTGLEDLDRDFNPELREEDIPHADLVICERLQNIFGGQIIDNEIATQMEMVLSKSQVLDFVLKGGEGSGNFGHAGRPGEVGGSADDGVQNTSSADASGGDLDTSDEIQHLHGASLALRAITDQQSTPPMAGHPSWRPGATADLNADNVSDFSRVGVGAMDVPPPPPVPSLPNLTRQERQVETSFIRAYEQDPDGLAGRYRDAVVSSVAETDEPPVFATDDAKGLSQTWDSGTMDQDQRATNRSTMNIALHQTANAIAKRAFVQYLDTLSEGDNILVTVGGCGAGKGYALKQLAKTDADIAGLKSSAQVIWDSAGDQNATENPWVQQEAEARGLNVTYLYVHADPKIRWSDKKMGVVARANDTKDGRMIDAMVFVDSYALGAKNHQAFYEEYRDSPSANFVFIDGNTLTRSNGIPPEGLAIDRQELYKFAVEAVLTNSDISPRVRAGALVGRRIWKSLK